MLSVSSKGDGKMVSMESKQVQIVADFPQVLQKEVFFQPLVTTPPLPECEVCVIVPVRNEAQTLNATLAALINQVDLQGQRLDPKRYEIILLLNNCSDRSADIARIFAKQHPDIKLYIVEISLPPSEAYIGRVRQILMDEAYRRLNSLGRKRLIIASTDGDSQVTETWIAANMYEIACGADAVGGRILTDKAGRLALHPYARACHLREVGYRYLIAELEGYIDPTECDNFPRHYQHYGASLAVTTEMYTLAGGLPPVRTPEDVAFYQALLRVNARFRHSPRVRVVTSARLTGRTDIGLANQLNEWAEMGKQKQSFLVESAAAIEARFTARRQLRILWLRLLDGYLPQVKDVVSIAESLGISSEWLLQEIQHPQTFGKLFERVEQRQEFEGIWASRWQKVDIKEAIGELRFRRKAFALK
jgi:Glycosyl transferase family 2